jgi:hypothetical protein
MHRSMVTKKPVLAKFYVRLLMTRKAVGVLLARSERINKICGFGLLNIRPNHIVTK